jgi:REP-associated tyrosine transposase
MSRPIRIEFKGAFYHVMNRGRGRQSVFKDDNDYQAFYSTLNEAWQRFGLEVHGFCLMGNHYHLLLKTPEGNLSRAMRHVSGVYTQRYNRHHKTDGPLFRGRYKAILIDSDACLLHLSKYIHLSPLTAGLVESFEEYPWSSCQTYLKKAKCPDWLFREEVWGQLNVKNRVAHFYRKFMEKEDLNDDISNFYARERLAPILGDEAFRANYAPVPEALHGEVARSDRYALQNRPSLSDIVAEVARQFAVPASSIYELRKGRGQRNTPRKAAMYLAQRVGGYRLTEIAEEFGLRHYGGVSYAAQAVKVELETDRKMQKIVNGIINGFNGKVRPAPKPASN